MRRAGVVAFTLLLGTPALCPTAPFEYDVLITGGRVLDGAGNPWFYADVGVRGDTIAAVGLLRGAAARTRIDARGRAVSPGFIDIHNHCRNRIFLEPAAENFIRQGVTTVFEGNDGDSPPDLRAFFQRLSATPASLNVGMFAGQGTIREAVLGTQNRLATADEIRRMQSILRRFMLDGAFGLSTGLFYVPGSYTPTEELVQLATVAGQMSGLYISHMRDETSRVVQSVEETVRIAEEAHLPAQVTHHKIVGAINRGRSAETLRIIEAARRRGVDVTIDQYPYTASMTSVSAALFPQWALAGGRTAFAARINDPAQLPRIRAVVVDRLRNERGGGDPKNVVLAQCIADARAAGRTLGDLTAERGKPATIEDAADTVIDLERTGDCEGIFHAISEEDLERILSSPLTMIASDGDIPGPDAVAHPRSYGTFPRVLGLYVREKRLLSLEEAIRKMTGMPAARLKLPDRGLLRRGMKADLVVFDPETVADRATYIEPRRYPSGIDDVFVNGRPVVLNEAVTEERPGRALYSPARQ